MILLVFLGLIVCLAVLFMVGITLLSWLVLVGTFLLLTLVLMFVDQDPYLAFFLAVPVTGALFWGFGRFSEQRSAVLKSQNSQSIDNPGTKIGRG